MAKRKRQSQQQQQTSMGLKHFSPLSQAQKDMIDAYAEHYHLFLYGCAGTGKTFYSLYLALKDVMKPNSPYHKVIIVRSAVPSRDVGFMPGTLREKLAVYEAPYMLMVNKILERGDGWQVSVQKNLIELMPTSYMRGVTIENAIVIVDEIQNMNYEELATVITRVGNDCRVIFCGDIMQNDLYRSKFDSSGMTDFQKVVEEMNTMELIEFTEEDIVRSGLCREFILAENRTFPKVIAA